jgi:excisionase family DNA binding protein
MSAHTATDAPVLPLLLSVEDAASVLAVGRTSIYQLIWSGELRPVRIRRSVRFTMAELERFVTEHQDSPPSP